AVAGGETRAQARGPVCFQSAGEHELTVGGRKLAGSAQRRVGPAFLQHGSLLAGPRHAELVELLAPARRGGRTAAGVRAVTTDLGALLGRPLPEPELAALGRRLADAFGAALGLTPAWEPPPALPDDA
ncbi:MAG: lipoyl protein ligase domain-containing protein, partial [Candidatus Krumholzibacteriia bacterium]